MSSNIQVTHLKINTVSILFNIDCSILRAGIINIPVWLCYYCIPLYLQVIFQYKKKKVLPLNENAKR